MHALLLIYLRYQIAIILLVLAVGIVLFFLVEKVVRYVEEHHSGYAHHHHHHHYNKQHGDANDEVTEKQMNDGEKTDSKALHKVLCFISCVFFLYIEESAPLRK
jgi:hypothetical protein